MCCRFVLSLFVFGGCFWHVVSWPFGVALCTVPSAVASRCVLAHLAGARLVGCCRPVLLGSCGFHVLFPCVLLCSVLVCGEVSSCVVWWYVSVRCVVSLCGALRVVALCGALRYMVVCGLVVCGVASCLVVCRLAVLCRVARCRVLLRCLLHSGSRARWGLVPERNKETSKTRRKIFLNS